MLKITRELITMTIILVALFLIVSHSTGFARSVSALGGVGIRLTKTLQGR